MIFNRNTLPPWYIFLARITTRRLFFYDLVTSLRFPEPAQLGITTKSLCLKPWFSYYPVTSLRFLEPTQLEITIKSLYLKLRYHYSESQHKNSRLLITERHNKLCCLYPVGGGFFFKKNLLGGFKTLGRF